jgi:hypothetical protein
MGITRIRIQSAFVLAIGLKVFFSLLSWLVGDPWILGFTLPLLVMGAYIAIGLARRQNDVSDEKFADSCYYLGFIFTITSLVFSLFDLPQIGDRITLIAVRFGAAMVSTVAGLAVRVYLVSFRPDAADALHLAEDAIVESYAQFRERLLITVEKMQQFHAEVELATRGTIDRVNLQIEAVGETCGERLRGHFTAIALEQRRLSQRLFDEMHVANARAADVVGQYADVLEKHLERIDAASVAFTAALTQRAEHPALPDDYFSRTLAAPLEQLARKTAAVADGVGAVSIGVDTSARTLFSSLQEIRAKTAVIDGALDKVLVLAQHQERITALGDSQAARLESIAAALLASEAAMTEIAAALGKQNATRTDLRQAISTVGLRLDAKAQRIAANVQALELVR